MRKSIVMAVLLTLTAFRIAGQENNFSFRPEIQVEKKFSEKFTLEWEHQTRYFTNLNEFERFSTALEGNYAFTEKWSAGMGYSLLYNHNIDEDFYAIRNRYFLYLEYKQVIGDWDLSFIEKFRSTHYNKAKEDTDFTPKNVLFSEVDVAYNIRSIPLSPYLNGQLRYEVNHPINNKLNQYRWSVGAKYKFNKLIEVDLYFEQRGDLNVDLPDMVKIIGAVLKFSI